MTAHRFQSSEETDIMTYATDTQTQKPSWALSAETEFFERELASFMPDRVFDAHTHLWHPDHSKWGSGPDQICPRCGLTEYGS